MLKVAERKVGRRGFTLIELLVVIAIIAILAAILFPVFTKARDNAKLARCMVHVKECGVAGLMYMDAWDGRFPIPRIRNLDGTVMASRSWPEGQCVGGQFGTFGDTGAKYSPPKFRPLNKYIKSIDLFRCPSEKRQECTQDTPNGFPWVRFGSSYEMNVTFHYPIKPDNYFLTLLVYTGSTDLEKQYVGRKLSEIKRPRRMVFMAERPLHAYAGVRAGSNAKPANYVGHGGDQPWTPIVFCDGHVEYILMTAGLNGPRWALAQKGWCPFAPNEGD